MRERETEREGGRDRSSERDTERSSGSGIDQILRAIHNIVEVRPIVFANPLARSILHEFGLYVLIDISLQTAISAQLFNYIRNKSSIGLIDVNSEYLKERWDIFFSCLQPIQTLTTPSEIMNEEDFDDILTIELRYGEKEFPSLATISHIISYTRNLYNAASTIIDNNKIDSLSVIYVASGSAFRIDLKGAGEVVKEVKNLLIETWMAIRHRKAEDLSRNSKAILESIEVVKKINSMAEKNTISSEDAQRINKTIIDSAIGIFQNGALIREISSDEVVENVKLLEPFKQRLIPEHASVEDRQKETEGCHDTVS